MTTFIALTSSGDRLPGADISYHGNFQGTTNDQGEISFPYCSGENGHVRAVHHGRGLKANVPPQLSDGSMKISLGVRNVLSKCSVPFYNWLLALLLGRKV